jgi:DNA-binding SARP family transcriptional activator
VEFRHRDAGERLNMQNEAECGTSAWSAEVEALVHDLRTLSHRRADAALGCALLAVDEALDTWRTQDRRIAVQEHGLRAARAGEERARQRVRRALDLVTDLAALPMDPAPETAPAPETPHRAAKVLEVVMLGGFELRFAGRPVTEWRGRRGPAVLQFLASRRGRFVDREVLTEAVWPGLGPDIGRHRVHQAVYALRQTLHQLDPGRNHIVCENGAYRLDPGVPIRVDVERFEQLADAGDAHGATGDRDAAIDAYRDAERLYRGDFLEDSPYADWAAAERDRLRARYVGIGARLAELQADRGDHRAALAVCLKVLERDRCNEEVTRRAMRSHVASDNRTSALHLYKSLEAELAAEFDVKPSEATVTLYGEILAG